MTNTFTTCTATTTAVAVDNLKNTKSNIPIKFRILATLSSNSANDCAISTIQTSLSGGELIDKKTSGNTSFTRGTNTNLAVDLVND